MQIILLTIMMSPFIFRLELKTIFATLYLPYVRKYSSSAEILVLQVKLSVPIPDTYLS